MGAEIADYGIIGNGRSCALISHKGSLDWLCWPRFDSPSLFGALLDPKLGTWKIHPKNAYKFRRQYIENTNVLQTIFYSKKNTVILTDFMPAFSEEEKNKHLHPEHEIIRQLECSEGEMEIEIHYHPAPNYGQDRAKIKDLGTLGMRTKIGKYLLTLHSQVKFTLHKGLGAKAHIHLKAGEKIVFSLTFGMEGPAIIPCLKEDFVSYKILQTTHWWQNWANRAQYSGPYKKHVIRSALTLKILGYAPSGAFIAAPTTSLPEKIGGNLNWDYRYCWLRDASFTVRSLLALGYWEEAEAFINWMLHSTRLTLPKLKVVYDVYGEGIIQERELPFLRGYKNSPPVRIGVAIRDQNQLDVYGEVLDSVAHFVQQGGQLDQESKKMVCRIGEFVCNHWNEKDSGIWEERTDIQYYTHSRLMCWVALDKLIKLQKECNLSKRKLAKFEKYRSLIRKTIEREGWNKEKNTYVSYLNGSLLDASLLLMPSFDFHASSSSAMQQTYKTIEEVLQIRPGLIYRYEKSFHNEGAFLICSFWKVDFLARGGGSLKEAQNEFEAILTFANDLDLFSEEVDVHTNKLIGNFPQAFTHIGLINAALLIEERTKK